MRKGILLILLVIMCICCISCNKKKQTDDVKWLLEKKMARIVQDDGWVYTFSYSYYKDENEDDGLIPYQFYGVNLRYRYNDDYKTNIIVDESGEKVTKSVPQTIQILGESGSAKIKSDMEKIADILKYNGGEVSNEELLQLQAEDISFEELDENIFIKLIHTALNGEVHKEGNYDYLPSYALLSEPEYLDGYKFQIGFVSGVGCVDVIFIDVLYRTGNGYDDYEQLSDLADTNEADEEQIKAYNMIKEISAGIVNKNDLVEDCEKNKNNIVADIDFMRLYSFLKNIEDNNYFKYVVEPSW